MGDLGATLKAWGWALAIGLNLLLCWIGWTIRQSFVSRRELSDIVTAVNARQVQSEKDILRLQEQLAAAPSHADLMRLDGRVTEVAALSADIKAELSSVAATTRAMARTLDLLNQHHLGGDGK